ncbi:glycosyltransferase family 4 protein [Brachybacterium subflavum]|uniref:glycosyltransferase family 4 protein n=1 Tax=Brachybacterium subflavum TaxID=2585206 RepID=UPI001D0D1C23|nr:glycosyltransferase family 4 protein [Brachybacterium subflavum]
MTRLRLAVVSTDPGIPVLGAKGASVHLQSVLRVLVEAGHEVHVLTPRPEPLGHPLARRLHLHALPEVGRGPAAQRERAAQAADAAVGPLLTRIAPDLVYERYALWGRGASTWARAHGAASILEVNAPLIDEQATHRELADRPRAEAVAREAFAAAQAITCVSDAVADWVRARLPEDSAARPRVLVLPNGVDVERITPAPARARAEGADPVRSAPSSACSAPVTVGFLGTLKPWHGVDVLVEAVARAAPRPRLLVVGEGPLRARLEERSAQLGVDLELTGAVAPDEVAAQLHRMDVACAPYPDSVDHYFSPLKVLEYLAAGLPVVASSIGQIPALLDHGRLGELVAPGDPDALAAALTALAADPERRRALGEAARRAAVAEHTWRGVVERALGAVGLPLGPATGRASGLVPEPEPAAGPRPEEAGRR